MTPPTETFRELEVNTQKLQFLAQDLETSHNERGRLSTRISELEKEVSRLQGVETRLQTALVELDVVCKVKNTYSARIAELDLRLEMVKSELIEFKKKAIKEEDGGGEPEVKALKAKYGKLKEELMLTQVVLEERSRELDDIKRLIKEVSTLDNLHPGN
ncbi:hypothetical protein HDU99_009296 [Rhizoclosmatium hyalinum]|nr:hypothetical protein HDU99_009296 [Rhizoclosmatium hyalinum]